MKVITYQNVLDNNEFNTYVNKGGEMLEKLGFTDHSAVHTLNVGETAAEILIKFGYSARQAELAKIAGYVHDIGNMINRSNHAQTGALMAFTVLTKLDADPSDIAVIVSAIGNHDENVGIAIDAVSAAIIIADKTDVHRSRVRNWDFTTLDIHQRVNYAVVEKRLDVLKDEGKILLNLTIDTDICSIMDYFDIFLTRMSLCKKAAMYLHSSFGLSVNNSTLF